MKADKISTKSDKMKILIEIESSREKLILMSIFYNTYELRKLANEKGDHLLDGESQFTHEEIKEVADKIYSAI